MDASASSTAPTGAHPVVCLVFPVCFNRGCVSVHAAFAAALQASLQ